MEKFSFKTRKEKGDNINIGLTKADCEDVRWLKLAWV
jgi:hypothetical protein